MKPEDLPEPDQSHCAFGGIIPACGYCSVCGRGSGRGCLLDKEKCFLRAFPNDPWCVAYRTALRAARAGAIFTPEHHSPPSGVP